VRVEQLARLPALDEREPGGIVAALVQRVEDAAVLRMRGRDERLERLEALGLLAGCAVKEPTTTTSDIRCSSAERGRS
jgi:hypothetical protein